MSIQQNINQLATVGAALYTQTPQYEAEKLAKVKQAEANRLRESTSKTMGSIQQLGKDVMKRGNPYEKEAFNEVVKDKLKDVESNYETAYRNDPTPENLQALVTPKAFEKMAKGIRSKMDEALREKANNNVKKQQETMLKQKQEIEEHRNRLLNMPTSLGGKLKDLSPELQETIIREYEKNGK